MLKTDILIVGGGIVGLATAMRLSRVLPHSRIAVIEKELKVGTHQTGNNSGVIHSGIYYQPGSFKSEYCKRGLTAIVEFCRENNIAHQICGKLIAATSKEEIPLLHQLYKKGIENKLDVRLVSSEEAKEIEPHLQCLEAIHVKSTGIVDYKEVAAKYAELIQSKGTHIFTSTRLVSVSRREGKIFCETTTGSIETRFFINCAGLYSDRVASLFGAKLSSRIIPFRGEYYQLVENKRNLVRNMIYPVPNPHFPFLGVHLTRTISGEIHAGPNAVLALSREGYTWYDVNMQDLGEILLFPGFLKFAMKYFQEGIFEMVRSMSKSLFVKSLQKMVPSLEMQDVVSSSSGVRAQALGPDGRLVNDFLIEEEKSVLHIVNVPSPAATCSLEIGRVVAERVVKQLI